MYNNIGTCSITTFTIMILSIHNGIELNDNQHNITAFRVVTLSITFSLTTLGMMVLDTECYMVNVV